MSLGEESCPGNCLFAQVVISDFEGGDELKESSEVKRLVGSLWDSGRHRGQATDGAAAQRERLLEAS